ncbi:hypothetical protein D3C87_79550 [compost metagenome]
MFGNFHFEGREIMLDYDIAIWETNLQENFEGLIVLSNIFNYNVTRREINSSLGREGFTFLFRKDNKNFAIEFILHKEKIEYINIIKRSSEDIIYELESIRFGSTELDYAIEFAKSLL